MKTPRLVPAVVTAWLCLGLTCASGSHYPIVGGALQGNNIHGRVPHLTIRAPDDTGRGRWIPTTSVDEYNTTHERRFVVSSSHISTHLPDIGRFAKPNLGFLG